MTSSQCKMQNVQRPIQIVKFSLKVKCQKLQRVVQKVTGTALLLPKIFVNNGMPGKEKGRDEAVGNVKFAM